MVLLGRELAIPALLALHRRGAISRDTSVYAKDVEAETLAGRESGREIVRHLRELGLVEFHVEGSHRSLRQYRIWLTARGIAAIPHARAAVVAMEAALGQPEVKGVSAKRASRPRGR